MEGGALKVQLSGPPPFSRVKLGFVEIKGWSLKVKKLAVQVDEEGNERAKK